MKKAQITILALLFISGFFYAQKTKAALHYQTHYDDACYGLNVATNDPAGAKGYCTGGWTFLSPTSTMQFSTGKLTSLTLHVYSTTESGANGCLDWNNLLVVDELNNQYASTNFSDLCRAGNESIAKDFTFRFATSSTVDFASHHIQYISFGSNYFSFAHASTSLGLGFETGTYYQTQAPYIILGTDNSDPEQVYQIDWDSRYSDYMTTPDFQHWDITVTVPSTTVPHFKIEYKAASSTSWTWTDYGYGFAGYGPNWPWGSSKSVALPYGQNYEALATLITRGGSTLATSSLLHFTISTGTPIHQIGVVETKPDQYWDDSWCPDTSFAVLGSDFGKGMCKVFSFLFIPGQTVVDKYYEVLSEISNKVPISYFVEIQNIITNAGNGTQQSMPTVAIQTSATSSLPNLNITLFSSSTLASATSNSGFTILRTIGNILLYIGFAAMCYETAIHLANKKGK